ncbi:MAG: hypothetical protein AAF556_10960 [Pseudomonadota bacterium]
MARLFLIGFLAIALLVPGGGKFAFAQDFLGNETGQLRQFQRFQPNALPFGGDQQVTCVRDREITRNRQKICIYNCANGSQLTRTFGRVHQCELSFDATQRTLVQEQRNVTPTECRLRRIRLTRTDKICLYNCDGQTVNQPVALSQTCDRKYRR